MSFIVYTPEEWQEVIDLLRDAGDTDTAAKVEAQLQPGGGMGALGDRLAFSASIREEADIRAVAPFLSARR